MKHILLILLVFGSFGAFANPTSGWDEESGYSNPTGNSDIAFGVLVFVIGIAIFWYLFSGVRDFVGHVKERRYKKLRNWRELKQPCPYCGSDFDFGVNEDGSAKCFMCGIDFNGKKHGLRESYYENGQLEKKANYKDWKPHGLWEYYYENGQLEAKENYKDWKRHGTFEYYYENGQLEWKLNFKDGERHGPYESYYENGQLKSKRCYRNGEKVDMSYCEE